MVEQPEYVEPYWVLKYDHSTLVLATRYASVDLAEKARRRLRHSSGRSYTILKVDGDTVKGGPGFDVTVVRSESAERTATARTNRRAALTAAEWAWRSDAAEALPEVLDALGIVKADLTPRADGVG